MLRLTIELVNTKVLEKTILWVFLWFDHVLYSNHKKIIFYWCFILGTAPCHKTSKFYNYSLPEFITRLWKFFKLFHITKSFKKILYSLNYKGLQRKKSHERHTVLLNVPKELKEKILYFHFRAYQHFAFIICFFLFYFFQ